MKKLKLKISRGAFSALALLALFLLGTGSAKAEELILLTEIQIGYSGDGTKYTFTSPSDGELTMILKPNVNGGYTNGPNFGEGNTYLLYLSSDNSVVECKYNNGTDVGAPFLTNVTEAKFNIKANTEYYILIPYWDGTALLYISDNSGNTGEGPTDPPTENKVDDLIIPNNNVTASSNDGYQFTADKTGELNITFTNIPENNILYKYYSDGIFYDIVSFADGVSIYDSVWKWNVTTGNTYYIDTRYLSGTFSIEIKDNSENPGGGSDDEKVIQLNQIYSIPVGTAFTFTPSTSGTLRIQTNNSGYPGGIEGFGSQFFWEDEGGNFGLTNISIGQALDDPVWGYGCWYEYQVTGGQAYYFLHWEYGTELKVMFTMEGGEEPPVGPGDEDYGIIEIDNIMELMENKIYTFTPSFTGTLRIQTDNSSYPGGPEGEASSFFFEDENKNNPLINQNVGQVIGDLFFGYGIWYEYSVKAGQTYYFCFTDVYSDNAVITVQFTKVNETTGPEVPDDGRNLLPVGESNVTVQSMNNEKYYFTPASDGFLTMNSSSMVSMGGSLFSPLYTTDGNPVVIKETDCEMRSDMGNNYFVTMIKWELVAGNEYYFQYKDNIEEGKALTFTFEPKRPHLYLIGTVSQLEMSEDGNNPIEMTYDINSNSYTHDEDGFELRNGLISFYFIAKDDDDVVIGRYGAGLNTPEFITPKEIVEMTETTEEVKPFVWYSAGKFNFNVSLENSVPTLVFNPTDHVYSTEMNIIGNDGNTIAMKTVRNGVYTAEDVAISGEFVFTPNTGDWTSLNPMFIPTGTLTDGELPISAVKYYAEKPAFNDLDAVPGCYDVTLDLTNNDSKNPVATFTPASVKIALGLNENDTYAQSGTIKGNEIEMLATEELEMDYVILYLHAPEGATIYFKKYNVAKLNAAKSNAMRAPVYQDDNEFQPAEDYEGYTVVHLPVLSTGNLDLYYENNGVKSATQTYSFSVDRGVTVGVDGIDSVDEGETLFFNLQGVRVDNPENGIFIKVVNGKATKVLVGK